MCVIIRKIRHFTFTLQEFTENVKFHIFQFLQIVLMYYSPPVSPFILWVLWEIIKKDMNSYYINPTSNY